MSVRNWPTLAAKTAVAASLLAAAAACGSSGSSSPPAAAGATSAAPLSTAALVSGSKQEKGLLIYSNALSSQMQEVTKAFQAKYPWIHVTVSDDEDPVVFSKYAAQHATGVRTADILIASAPGLWVGAVNSGFLQPFTPAGICGLPRLHLAGQGPVHLLARSRDHDLQQGRAEGAAGAVDGRADRPGRDRQEVQGRHLRDQQRLRLQRLLGIRAHAGLGRARQARPDRADAR